MPGYRRSRRLSIRFHSIPYDRLKHLKACLTLSESPRMMLLQEDMQCPMAVWTERSQLADVYVAFSIVWRWPDQMVRIGKVLTELPV